MNDNDIDEIREVLPEEMPIDVKTEVAEMIQEGDHPVDMGMELVITPVPGEAFGDSHPHEIENIHGDGPPSVVLHLTPEHAQKMDGHLCEMIVDILQE